MDNMTSNNLDQYSYEIGIRKLHAPTKELKYHMIQWMLSIMWTTNKKLRQLYVCQVTNKLLGMSSTITRKIKLKIIDMYLYPSPHPNMHSNQQYIA
jgi:hypothetical protein